MDVNGSSTQTAISSPPIMSSVADGHGDRPGRLKVRRTGIVLKPTNSRVVIRPFELTNPQRIERILARLMSLSEPEVDFAARRRDARVSQSSSENPSFFLNRFEQVKQYLLTDQPLSENRRLLIGSYFTQEYSLESAALFNPSMVWHPDQSGLEPGSRRFLLSLAPPAKGIFPRSPSAAAPSIPKCRIRMDEPTRFVTAPENVPNTLYDKNLFFSQAARAARRRPLRRPGPASRSAISSRSNSSSSPLASAMQQSRPRHHENEPVAQGMLTLARANYEISFSPEQHISERVVFPSSPTEANGIEDARFVEFHDDGSVRYYATYTAFDGKVILPQILETDDFLHFKISTLEWPGRAKQGLRPLSAQGQGPLRHALAAR